MSHKTSARKVPREDAAQPEVPLTQSRVSFKIHRVNAKLGAVANRLHRQRKLDLISSRILVFLLEAGELRVGQLVEIMVLPQSTISHQLLNLERRGLISRTRAQDDNRAVAVTLTEDGRRVAAECHDLSRQVYLHMTQRLSEAEIAQLSTMLDRLFLSLEDFVPAEIAG